MQESIMSISERMEKYASVTIEDPELRWFSVYVITNELNGKNYVGQAISHIKTKDKYKPYGSEGRLLAHFREANSNKEHQCTYLNNAIREYGPENFSVHTIYNCSKKKIDELEIKAIQDYDSMYPNGYNIMRGGRKIEGYIEKDVSIPRKSPSLEHKKEMSERTRKLMTDKKMQLCMSHFIDNDIKLKKFDEYIKKGKDYDSYECYMLQFTKGKRPFRAIFGGQYITLTESFNKCKEFYNELKENLAKHLDAGNALESEDTTQY